MDVAQHNVLPANAIVSISKLQSFSCHFHKECFMEFICSFLRSTCVSRCPPRSFPNQGGVCWACHESCETCAGAGQDSCLTCAPAHLHVVDLAVCLQVCPDGYYESKCKTFPLFSIHINNFQLERMNENNDDFHSKQKNESTYEKRTLIHKQKKLEKPQHPESRFFAFYISSKFN